jgi:uncharacterized protein (DUF885 family)
LKTLFKRGGLALAALLAAALVLAAHTWFAKPLSLNWFYDRAFVKFGIENPELLTQLGVLEQFGLRSHNGKLTDASIAAEDREYAKVKDEYATFKRYDAAALTTPSERVSHAVFDVYMKNRVAEERWRFHNHPVNQLFGVQSEIPNLLSQSQRVNDEKDAELYLARMDAIPKKFADVLDGVKAREQKGILPQQFVVEKVILQMQGFMKEGAKANPIYTTFKEKLEKISAMSPATREALLARTETSLKERVFPAYQTLIAHFETLRKKATRNDGVWALPDGEAYYQYEIESQTTTTMKADEIHNFGLSEVARIRTEMLALLDQIGLNSGPLAQRMEALAKRPDQLYPNNAAGREQILKDYQAIIDEINTGLSKHFGRLPQAKVEVKRVPEFAEKTSPAAYYSGPAMDGTRPGVFYANLREVSETPKYSMRTLAYHEAVPGHHMQIAIAQELKGLPIFRGVVHFTAYIEGWALYSERLAWEMGLQKTPEDNLGRLQDEMMRAVRLVVDTGLHAKRWTREEAIKYMMENTGMNEASVVTEIERYLVNPGQALAYKIGMTKILALRERAQQALGAKFDLRTFHDAVLVNGAMPLTVLEQVVDQYIKDALAKA